jgi:integrase
MERSLSLHRSRRLGFREQTAPRSETDMGPGDLTQVHSSSRAARRDSETVWMAYVPTFRHTFSTLPRSVGTEFKVMQELLRHSSLRSTLDVYTQAISPAKHAAQAAVLALVFASETTPSAVA